MMCAGFEERIAGYVGGDLAKPRKLPRWSNTCALAPIARNSRADSKKIARG